MKQKIKTKIKTAVLYGCLALVAGFLLDCLILKVYYFVLNPVGSYALAEVRVPDKPILKEKPQSIAIREYIRSEILKAGLDPIEVDCLHDHEADYNPNAFNINSNNTIDIGVWQINSIHIKSGSITLQCAANYECATQWAIKKRLKDKSWNAWVGYKQCK